MIDIQVVTVKDILRVSTVRYAVDNNGKALRPLSLDIQGNNFNRATEVLVNDLLSPEFIIRSSTRILAQIPLGQENSQIRRVLVLSQIPISNEKSVLHFEVGRSFRRVSGIQKLVQIFSKIVIQSPSSHLPSPGIGGGLIKAVGTGVGRGNSKQLTQNVVASINRAKDQLLTIQQKNVRIPADERLLNAIPENVGFNPNTTAVVAQVRVISVAGDQATASFAV